MRMFRTALIALASCTAAADTEWDFGAWRAGFDASESRLELVHEDGARVSGVLSFTGPSSVTDGGVAGAGAKSVAWRVCDSRDGVRNRLALVDTKDNVNGYVMLRGEGGKVTVFVHHRTAFAYGGTLSFSGDIVWKDDAFACRVSPLAKDRVLQVKSGPAVSLLDDALFSRSSDSALVCKGAGLSRAGNGHRFSAALAIDDVSGNELSFTVEKDYYKSRWVPYYRPLDRARAPHAPTGWLSWNTYFDTAGSKENLDEARFAAKWFKPFGMEVWLIESWQDNSPRLPVRNFHNMNLETYKVQFPEGMRWLAGEIKKLGFKPGLWMAPFGTGSTNFYNSHRGWFLHRKQGEPVQCWNGRFTLDPSVPEAREHLKGIFNTASRVWGYEFFKIDGMSSRGPSYCANLYERPDIRALFRDGSCRNPFELCIKAFREGIGPDRTFLACQGHFTGAEAGFADCSRTGADIVHPYKPVTWKNILLQARCTVNQIFVNSIVFWCDPDCMLISQGALGREQAQVETTVVALPGQQMFAGDKLRELAPDRVKLIQQALPVCETRPAKLYPQFGHLPVWDLHVSRPFGDWHVVALFNWDDAEKTVHAEWPELGEDPGRRFVAWEFWNGEYLGEKTGRLSVEVPPRSVRLVALRPRTGRPQFLTSDRHVTQGGVELKDESWDGKTLSVKIAAVGGFPSTVRFAVPGGWKLTGISSEGAVTETSAESGGKVLAVKLSASESRDVELKLAFAK